MKEKEFVKVEKLEDGVTVITTNKNVDSIISQLMGLENNINEQSTTWIDLGLPSGTLWCSKNEDYYYTYYEAVEKFGNNLPTREQFEELKNECQWKWDNKKKGYTVTGSNGNSIFLPAAGYRYIDGNVHFGGSRGYYWSSKLTGSIYAWSLGFNSYNVYTNFNNCDDKQSVRLVKQKTTKK